MLLFNEVSSFFDTLKSIFISSLLHIDACQQLNANGVPGMIIFTCTALFSLHSSRPSFIGPSPQNRPVSTDRHSGTGSGLRPTPQMGLRAEP
jgi:hypothetical protein